MELLAVIAVLALILIIAVPKITKTLDNSKNRTLELSAKSLARSAEEAYLEKESYGLDEEITCESVANINSDDYLYCNISFNEEGKAYAKVEEVTEDDLKNVKDAITYCPTDAIVEIEKDA